jgi:acetolactate synthase-1/2/3 large subunit
MTTGGYTLLHAPRPAQQLVHCARRAEELGRVYAADLLLQASLACAAKALAALAARPAGVPAGPTGRPLAHADYEANRCTTPVEPLDMAEVMKTVQRLAPADTVYTNGAGNFSGWLHRFTCAIRVCSTTAARSWRRPRARWATACRRRWPRLLQPHRTVVNVAGDGDFLMTGQELATATGYGAGRGSGKLVSIVVDNGSYGTIRMHQEREYPGRVSGSELFNPDFAALARARRTGWRRKSLPART